MKNAMSRRKLLRLGVISSTGAAALVSVLGSRIALGQTTSGPGGGPITLYLLPGSLKGSDGQMHDAIIPSSMVLQSGVPTVLNVVNYDTGTHTITAPDLGLNLMINAGGSTQPVVTTATITVPQPGAYRWYCGLTCDGPSHFAMSDGWDGPGQDGFMAGNIVVV